MQTDVVIVGAGPSGIFTALEMIKRGTKQRIVIVEKGLAVEQRRCPKAVTGRCVNCKPYCHITTGFSGAGAFSGDPVTGSRHENASPPRTGAFFRAPERTGEASGFPPWPGRTVRALLFARSGSACSVRAVVAGRLRAGRPAITASI